MTNALNQLVVNVLPATRGVVRMRQLAIVATAIATSMSLLAVELPAQGRGNGKEKSKGSVAQQQRGNDRINRENVRIPQRDERNGRDRDERNDRDRDRDVRNDRDRDARNNGVRGGKIPPGHLPRAGECRVWFDGRPPGQQPAPTSCERARADAFRSGGRVVYGVDRKNERDDSRTNERNNDRNNDRINDRNRDRNDARYPATTPDVIADVIFGRGGRVPQ